MTTKGPLWPNLSVPNCPEPNPAMVLDANGYAKAHCYGSNRDEWAKLFAAAPWLLLLARCFAAEWFLEEFDGDWLLTKYAMQTRNDDAFKPIEPLLFSWSGSITDAPEEVFRSVEAALNEK